MPKKSKRARSGRKYSRGRLWIQRRDAVFERAGEKCEVSGEPLRIKIDDSPVLNPAWKWRRAVDHLIPERAARKFAPGCDVHCLENLYCLSASMHAKKTAIEYLIFRWDVLGYKRELNRLGFPSDAFDKAWKKLCKTMKVPF